MSNPKVAIVTPIHNGIGHTLDFLRSIEKITYSNYEIIIVDDGSTDRSSQIISKEFPKVKILYGNGDLWWSGATNMGARYALRNGAKYILTINNDVIVHAKFLDKLVECSFMNPRSLVGGKIYYRKNKKRVWYFGAHFDPRSEDIVTITGMDQDFTRIEETPMLTGMGILIPAVTFKQIGYFDAKHFPQYLADSDFSLRAKAKGYKLLVTPESKIYTDAESSWVGSLDRITLKFFFQALFSIRSQFNIKFRKEFYRRHRGKGWRVALLKFYFFFMVRFTKRYIRERIGKKQ